MKNANELHNEQVNTILDTVYLELAGRGVRVEDLDKNQLKIQHGREIVSDIKTLGYDEIFQDLEYIEGLVAEIMGDHLKHLYRLVNTVAEAVPALQATTATLWDEAEHLEDIEGQDAVLPLAGEALEGVEQVAKALDRYESQK